MYDFKFLLLALAALLAVEAPHVSAAPTGVCGTKPYVDLLILSDFSLARDYCTQHYPVPPSTQTITAAATTVVTTTTINTNAAVTGTITVTASTTGAAATVTGPVTTITVTTVTATVTSTQPPKQKRTNIASPGKRANLGEILAAWEQLQSEAASFAQTLCSCIETTPTVTVSKTPTATSTATVTSTTATITATQTITNVITITPTVTGTRTTSVTATVTTTVAPPVRCSPPPQTTSAAGSSRVYTLSAQTCNGSPNVYYATYDIGQYQVGCAGTDERCAIAACMGICNGNSACVQFLVESDDPNDAGSWQCTLADMVFHQTSSPNVYGDEYIYVLN